MTSVAPPGRHARALCRATLGVVVDRRALSRMPWRNLAFRCDSLQRGNLIASTFKCLNDLHEFINSSASCTIEHFAQYSRVAPRVPSRDTLVGQCKKIAINVDTQKPQPLRISMAKCCGCNNSAPSQPPRLARKEECVVRQVRTIELNGELVSMQLVQLRIGANPSHRVC